MMENDWLTPRSSITAAELDALKVLWGLQDEDEASLHRAERVAVHPVDLLRLVEQARLAVAPGGEECAE